MAVCGGPGLASKAIPSRSVGFGFGFGFGLVLAVAILAAPAPVPVGAIACEAPRDANGL